METKKNEIVKENEIKGIAQADVQVIEQKEEGLKLFVEREHFTGTDGKQYWAYVLKGQVRGRDVRVDFAPKDKGGYEPLDIVFSIKDTAELIMTTETMTDASGTKMKYISYKVRNADELGVLECSIKPIHDSDKTLLTMIVDQLKAMANRVV